MTAPAPTAVRTATLARIRLNPHSRDVQRDLRDAHELHRTMMRLLPPSDASAARQAHGLLFRLEVEPRATHIHLQTTSTLHPDRLPPDYGHVRTKDLTPMFAALREGIGVRYRIVANPTKRTSLPPEEGKRGPVIPLTGAEADQWWHRKATEAGLHLHTLLPTPLPAARSPRGKDNRPRMRHDLIRFDGTATVTDAEALTRAVLTGIGRGKPYGAGLLSLAPA
ncbi:type I-E CRISPR-associated protein Cas6/Cse3/CasE [Streptomyces sp. NHF165]|uniref:type I-E CRISPR-associated protein Cas6/Cse3/CasE n=1 Tax=Streptomyces sp. NHF165 TaxID=2175864 RepID=UPI00132F24A9|nr:type I-E CRISPR-associated protein Cas6/Cse3/CasE [Streptomyces sp. NHF165]QHF97207.1 type I-E CRISPR-associated protein Cas6/Cse3/CasE [Streptomyces sp. NHF165]